MLFIHSGEFCPDLPCCCFAAPRPEVSRLNHSVVKNIIVRNAFYYNGCKKERKLAPLCKCRAGAWNESSQMHFRHNKCHFHSTSSRKKSLRVSVTLVLMAAPDAAPEQTLKELV